MRNEPDLLSGNSVACALSGMRPILASNAITRNHFENTQFGWAEEFPLSDAQSNWRHCLHRALIEAGC